MKKKNLYKAAGRSISPFNICSFFKLAAHSLWLAAFFFAGCENDARVIKAWTDKKIMTEEAKDITSYLSQEGKMRAKLKAPLMIRVAADTLYVEFPQSLHVDFYNDSTRIETWLDSRYGKYFEIGRAHV